MEDEERIGKKKYKRTLGRKKGRATVNTPRMRKVQPAAVLGRRYMDKAPYMLPLRSLSLSLFPEEN